MGLKKWLAKAGMELEDLGPRFGEMGRHAAEKMGSPRAGRSIGEFSIRHPRSTAAGAIIGAPVAGGVAGGLAGLGAQKLDSLTAGDENEELPPELALALEQAGQNPKKFHSAGRMPAQGAVLGAETGALAHFLMKMGGSKGGSLGKALGIGTGIGGLLGAGLKQYRKDEEE